MSDPACLCRQGGRDESHLVAQRVSATLQAQDILELTFTQPVMDSYSASLGVLGDVGLVAADPRSLEEVILPDEGNLNPGGEALYWVQNLTDMQLGVWSRGPGQSARALPVGFEPSDLGQATANCYLVTHVKGHPSSSIFVSIGVFTLRDYA